MFRKLTTIFYCFTFLLLSNCISRNPYLEGSIKPVDPSIKPKIAIVSNNRLASALGTNLFSKGFSVVERVSLVSVLREKSLQMSGVTEEQLIEAGRILNVDALVFVEMSGAERGTDIYSAFIKIVSVQSGAIIGSFNYQNGRRLAKDNFVETTNRLADAISIGYR